MSDHNLVRAWKDEDYRLSLSEAERASLPANPAGSLELTDAELDLVAGGGRRRSGTSCYVWGGLVIATKVEDVEIEVHCYAFSIVVVS